MDMLRLSDRGPTSVYQYLLPHEKDVVTVRKHPAKLIGPMSLCFAGFVAIGLLITGVIHGGTAVQVTIWAGGVVFLLYALIRAVAWSITYIVITNIRIVFMTGIRTKKMVMIRLRQVHDVSLQRSKIARLLGYGTFVAELTGQDQALRKIYFMPYPEEIFLDLTGRLPSEDEEEGTHEPGTWGSPDDH